jgi:hypothetical protein
MPEFLAKVHSGAQTRPAFSLDIRASKSHQRSWWIVHTQPTKETDGPRPESHQRALAEFRNGLLL